MAQLSSNNHGKKVIDSVINTASTDAANATSEIVSLIINDVKEWLINKYTKLKTKPKNNVDVELQQLEERIRESNELVDIGMEKKEIAVMWAMRKLGYSEDEVQKILDVANEAYQSKD